MRFSLSLWISLMVTDNVTLPISERVLTVGAMVMAR